MSKRLLDFQGLNAQLISRIRTLLPEWLPGGSVSGNEYVCGDLTGKPGRSLSVNLTTGKWADFASENRGGDLISLYAAIYNLDQKDAYHALRENYGTIDQPTPKPKPIYDREIIQPPANHELPFDSTKLEDHYIYRDAKGGVLFYITRWKNKDGKKVFTPYCYTNEGRWCKKAWPGKRPLYNLNIITQYPERPVLIVEGEKAARAAQEIPNIPYIVTTWPNGTNSVGRVDWEPLKNRNVLIWPDADEPGRKAAEKICEILHPIAVQVKIIDTSGFNGGKDAADFGFKSLPDFVGWAKPLAQTYPLPEPEPELPPVPLPETQNEPTATVIHAAHEDIPQRASKSELQMWENLGLKCSGGGRPYNNVHNVTTVINKHQYLTGKIWYDEFYQKILTTWGKSETPREWTDADDIKLQIFLQDTLGMNQIAKTAVQDAVQVAAKMNTKHEPRDWMDSLTWDRTPRVRQFLNKYMGCPLNDYTESVSVNFWVSMVARIYRPGCKADNMMILEGKQGRFKSTALSIIGGKWYVETNENPNSKDFYQIFQGKLLIEIGELDSFNKAETTKIKAVVSTSTDRFRPPYGRNPQDFPRQCIFVGTTNESNYLRDHTGGRRFWPISIGNIDTDSLREDRDQLFAEGIHLFNSGTTWHQVPESALKEQEQRRERDVWEELVLDYITGKKHVTALEVAVKGVGIDADKITPLVSRRIAKILRTFGCVAGNNWCSIKQKAVYGYHTPASVSVQRETKSQETTTAKLPNYAPF